MKAILVVSFVLLLARIRSISGKLPAFLCSPAAEKTRAKFLEGALKSAKSFVDDPMDIPGRDGRIPLSSGQLRGLSTLKLRGDPTVFCDKEESTATIISEFRTDYLSASYRWEYRPLPWLLRFGGTVSLNAGDFSVYAKALYTRAPGKPPVQVRKIEVKNLEDLSLEYTGTASWVLTRLSNILVPFFRSTLRKLLETSIKDKLNEELARRHMIR